MKFVNLTPHTLNIHLRNGEIMVLPPSGEVARIKMETRCTSITDGVEIFETKMGEVEGLPEFDPTKMIITSLVVKQAARAAGRTDVYSPGALVRDDQGRPIGCKGLSR